MATVSYSEPIAIRAGDSLAWRRVLADYPADVWTLSYTLINSSAKITITASASGQDHVIDVPAATSAAYAAGWYDYTAQVADGTDRVTIKTGRIEVLPDLSAETTYDNRSHARKMLEAIEAILEGKATAGQINIIQTDFRERSTRYDTAGLQVMRDRYRADVAAEDNAERIRNGLGSNRRIQTRLAR